MIASMMEAKPRRAFATIERESLSEKQLQNAKLASLSLEAFKQ